jgi:phosphoribosylformylglycinamidine cyclo-ligase
MRGSVRGGCASRDWATDRLASPACLAGTRDDPPMLRRKPTCPSPTTTRGGRSSTAPRSSRVAAACCSARCRPAGSSRRRSPSAPTRCAVIADARHLDAATGGSTSWPTTGRCVRPGSTRPRRRHGALDEVAATTDELEELLEAVQDVDRAARRVRRRRACLASTLAPAALTARADGPRGTPDVRRWAPWSGGPRHDPAGAADADDGDPCQAPRSEQVSEGPSLRRCRRRSRRGRSRGGAHRGARGAHPPPEVLDGIGGFGGLFALDTSRWREPVLVSGTDGVGTKVEIARRLGVLDTSGATWSRWSSTTSWCAAPSRCSSTTTSPSVGSTSRRVEALVRGIADGCVEAGCALVGGETAEHPGVLADDAFDLAGFGVGVVERDRCSVRIGSSRRRADRDLPRPGCTATATAWSAASSTTSTWTCRTGSIEPLGEELLEPTRIHAPDCLALLATVEVHALCHVTGGGIPGNLPRVLPDGLVADVDATSWREPADLRWLQPREARSPTRRCGARSTAGSA